MEALNIHLIGLFYRLIFRARVKNFLIIFFCRPKPQVSTTRNWIRCSTKHTCPLKNIAEAFCLVIPDHHAMGMKADVKTGLSLGDVHDLSPGYSGSILQGIGCVKPDTLLAVCLAVEEEHDAIAGLAIGGDNLLPDAFNDRNASPLPVSV